VAVIAVPSFVIAIYALLIFAVQLRWLPAIGAGEPGQLGDQLVHLILPSLAVGLGWVGYIARMVRASMLEVLEASHIRTARAFGLPDRMITYRYALSIAILPTVTLLGVGIGQMLSSAVFAEIVFARPGVGKLVYDAILTRNFPVVSGTVLVTTVLFVLLNLVADLIIGALDPRVRSNF
jgi:peptide/nickel transport system permease protein